MSSAENAPSNPSPAVNVGFSNVANRYGESSSPAGSRSSGKRSERSQHHSEEQTTPQRNGTYHEGGNSIGSGSGRRNRKSGGFLLDSVLTNGSPRKPARGAKQRVQDGELQVERKRLAQSRLSGDSSMRGSPLSREFQMDGAPPEPRDGRPQSRNASMDASQLVQMALNLSESRKRHVSSTLQVPLPAGKRVTSAPISNFGTVRAKPSGRSRSSQLSDDPSRDSPEPNKVDEELIDQSDNAVPFMDTVMDNVLHTFSPATLSRAEKARKYFELASEHRRLLQNLPPLKPDATAPGNYTYETASTPGSTYPSITRIASGASNKHVLGRPYNPIQSLRNRRVRIREKRPFSASPDAWADPENVKQWIDDVESAVRDPAYRGVEDRVQLPPFQGDDEQSSAVARNQQSTTRHRRTDTVGSVITRPENSWTIEPTELLADAYWTEKGDNKAYIETRYGTPIFPPPQRRSIDAPRISVEMHRGRKDEPEQINDEDGLDDYGRSSRRRRLMLPLYGSERRKNKLRSRSSSTSSGSTTDGSLRRTSPRAREDGDTNIGPLARHMQELIAKDERGELTADEVASPDHWNSVPQQVAASSTSLERPHRDSIGRPNGRASLEVPRELHRRARSADGRVGSVDQQTLFADDDIGSEPVSPVVSKNIPSMGIDLSPPGYSRHSLDEQQARPKKLPSFRSTSKERHKIGQADFADGTGNNLSPIPSASLFRPRSSQESSRPSDFKRHRTDESMASLKRLETGSTIGSIRESGSTVGRLLKGGRDRIGGLVFSDRFRNREKPDAGASSDVEDFAPGANGDLKRRITDLTDEQSEPSPRTSLERTRSKPQYHTSNLPTFTSSGRDRRVQIQSPTSSNSDPISRQQEEQVDPGRYEKSDRLAPPRIAVPQAATSNPELSSNAVDGAGVSRKSYGQLEPAFGVRNSLMPFMSTVPGISPAKRHWSIYDQVQPEQAEKITSRDIARTKALLLTSGIKAKEIQRRADIPRESPSTLVAAADTADQAVPSVSRKEEPLMAAHLLSKYLSTALSEFEGTVSRFQHETAQNLGSQLDELQHKATEHLTKLVHDKSDEADAFTVELTTRQPRDLKQVDDAVDLILRRRRRQFRVLRNTGFKLLEWLVLSIMWGIWFMVVVFNIFRRIVVGIFRFLRWLVVF